MGRAPYWNCAERCWLRPPGLSAIDKTFVEVSSEQIAQADGDLLFYSAFGDPADTDLAQVIGGPLWQRLDAVSGGRAYEVSDDLWYLGIGPIAADLVLDDLKKFAPT